MLTLTMLRLALVVRIKFRPLIHDRGCRVSSNCYFDQSFYLCPFEQFVCMGMAQIQKRRVTIVSTLTLTLGGAVPLMAKLALFCLYLKLMCLGFQMLLSSWYLSLSVPADVWAGWGKFWPMSAAECQVKTKNYLIVFFILLKTQLCHNLENLSNFHSKCFPYVLKWKSMIVSDLHLLFDHGRATVWECPPGSGKSSLGNLCHRQGGLADQAQFQV